MSRYAFPAISRISVAAMVAAAASMPAAPPVIENRGQALPKGAQRAIRGNRREAKARSKAAVGELVGMSNQTLVVAHLHPRWLRIEVERLMDAGCTVDLLDVQAIKAAGPKIAAFNALRGRRYTGPEVNG